MTISSGSNRREAAFKHSMKLLVQTAMISALLVGVGRFAKGWLVVRWLQVGSAEIPLLASVRLR